MNEPRTFKKNCALSNGLSTFASSQFCSRFTVHSFVHTFVHSFAHSFPLLLGAIHKACLTSRGGIFSTKRGEGNKLNIICSLTENLDEFKNQHIETCFEVKQVCTSIFNICFDIRWFFCKILSLYDAAISHIFLFCKNFTLFQMSITFPKIVIILMKFSFAYFAIFHFF